MKRTLIIPEALEDLASTDGTPDWAGPARSAGYADLESGSRLGAPRADEFLEGAKWVQDKVVLLSLSEGNAGNRLARVSGIGPGTVGY